MDFTATAGNEADGAGPPRAAPKAPARRPFQLINKIVEPLVRLGFVSPHAGPGLVVVETTGHRTGMPIFHRISRHSTAAGLRVVPGRALQ
jgi:hypothetical protein